MGESQERFIQPRDGTTQYQWSEIIGVSPFSFCLGEDYDAESPPPTYLPLSILNKPRGTAKDQILDLFNIPKEGGLVSEDQLAITNQRGVIVEIIK